MVKQKPLTNRELLIKVLVEIEDTRVYMGEIEDKLNKIDFASAAIALADGKTNVTIISPEPVEDDPHGNE